MLRLYKVGDGTDDDEGEDGKKEWRHSFRERLHRRPRGGTKNSHIIVSAHPKQNDGQTATTRRLSRRRECYVLLLVLLAVSVAVSVSFSNNNGPLVLPLWTKRAEQPPDLRLDEIACPIEASAAVVVMSNLTRMVLPVNTTAITTTSTHKTRERRLPWYATQPVNHASRLGIVQYKSPSDLWTNVHAANAVSTEARCRLPGTTFLATHVPHALQYLYACWSYWQYRLDLVQQQQSQHEHSGKSDIRNVTPVLYMDKNHQSLYEVFPRPTRREDGIDRGFARLAKLHNGGGGGAALPTLQGMLLMLYDWGVVFRYDNDQLDVVDATSVTLVDLHHGYVMLHRRHAWRMQNFGLAWAHERVHAYNRRDCYDYSLAVHGDQGETSPSSSSSSPLPQITLLNRAVNRRLMNQDALVHAINSDIYNNNKGSNVQVKVAYFESASFQDQIIVMANTDILLSPHGAQLALMPFLGAHTHGGGRCAAVHEIFPPNYCIPFFFGSLAHHSGIDYSYTSFDHVHGSDTNDSNVTRQCRVDDWENRGTFRQADLCPSVVQLMDTIRQLVLEWQACQQRQTFGDGLNGTD